ncbi:MAG: clostripain-related cysteine peptidase [Bdellovibrionota bacterium]
MRSIFTALLVTGLLSLGSTQVGAQQQTTSTPAKKKWTVLVFINGNNNLDSYGAEDINEMEEVGSSADVNVVVQWASYKAKTTKRLLVAKDNDIMKVTSKILVDMPRVDMGDYKELTKFLEWGMTNFPAEHYFVDVWNHGNGWKNRKSEAARNISYDDYTNNSITMPQLRMSLEAAQALAGKKIDIYGSDACLMNMVEVGTEIAGAVDIMVGSQETEPGDGWPYETWLARWNEKAMTSPVDIAKALTDTYIESYEDKAGSGVTFSVIDLAQMGPLNDSIKAFTAELMPMVAAEKLNFKKAIYSSANYYNTDYVDLMSLLAQMKTSVAAVSALQTGALVNENLSKAILYNKVYDHEANGLSIWAPYYVNTYTQSAARYNELKFQQATNWGAFLSGILK